MKNKRKFATNFLGANRARKCAKSTTRHQSQSKGEGGREREGEREAQAEAGWGRAGRQIRPLASFALIQSKSKSK